MLSVVYELYLSKLLICFIFFIPFQKASYYLHRMTFQRQANEKALGIKYEYNIIHEHLRTDETSFFLN